MGMSVRQNREPTGCRRLFAPGQNPRGRCKLSYGALMQIDLPAVGEPLGSDREGRLPAKNFFLQNEPNSPFRINKRMASLMASIG